MTHHEIQSLPDGRRKYACGTTYTPLAPEQRKYKVRKPDDPGAVRFHGKWYLPLVLASDEDRVWPDTREVADARSDAPKRSHRLKDLNG